MSHTHVINTSNVGKAQIRHSLAIAELRRILNLENISRIECYDISNIQGKQATGSMVVFVNGKPDKNLYRKFNIKNINIISIAKGKQELFIEGKKKPITLKQLPQKVYNLIKQLDDEAHRFAIAYHKKLREKYLLN